MVEDKCQKQDSGFLEPWKQREVEEPQGMDLVPSATHPPATPPAKPHQELTQQCTYQPTHRGTFPGVS